MAEVLPFTGITTVREPAEAVLEKAKGWGLDDVLLIGRDGDGHLAIGGNFSDSAEIYWLLAQASRFILEETD